jgi:hypothetical protein
MILVRTEFRRLLRVDACCDAIGRHYRRLPGGLRLAASATGAGVDPCQTPAGLGAGYNEHVSLMARMFVTPSHDTSPWQNAAA